MSTDDEMRTIADGQKTIADKIRALAAANHSRADIARVLQRSYQQVRNVLEQDKVRARSNTSPASPSVGVAESPAVYENEVDEAFRAKYPPTIRLELGKDSTFTIPAEQIEGMGWYRGGIIIAEVRNEGLFLLSSAASIRRVQAMVAEFIPPGGPSLVDELIADRRREAAAEEEK
jgi:hypothetical protein